MKVVAFAVGSYGDVEPFIVLGAKMRERGHVYSVVTFPEFRERVENVGLLFYRIPGDLNIMVSTLLADSDNSTETGIRGLKRVYEDVDGIITCFEQACRDADLLIFMQFSKIAYHFGEKYGIPCVRSFVFPSDPTKQFSALFSKAKENSIWTKWSYYLCDFFMSLAEKDCVDQVRNYLHLSRWHWYSNYTRLGNEKLLTLYQYSPTLAPRSPKWGKHIKITGPWYSEEDDIAYEPSKELKTFLEHGEPPIYIGFGSMNYKKMDELGDVIHKALRVSGVRAVLSGELNSKGRYCNDQQVFYVDFVPFSWLFPQVKGVVSHGGNGTVHYSLRSGKPTWVLSFGADQFFWGRRVHATGSGPYPLDIKKDAITAEVLAVGFKELYAADMQLHATRVQAQMLLDGGVDKACELLEDYMGRKKEKNRND
jgi:glycosyl transferase, putative